MRLPGWVLCLYFWVMSLLCSLFTPFRMMLCNETDVASADVSCRFCIGSAGHAHHYFCNVAHCATALELCWRREHTIMYQYRSYTDMTLGLMSLLLVFTYSLRMSVLMWRYCTPVVQLNIAALCLNCKLKLKWLCDHVTSSLWRNQCSGYTFKGGPFKRGERWLCARYGNVTSIKADRHMYVVFHINTKLWKTHHQVYLVCRAFLSNYLLLHRWLSLIRSQQAKLNLT